MLDQNSKLQYDELVEIRIVKRKELTMGQKILRAILVILTILLSYLLPQGQAIYDLVM